MDKYTVDLDKVLNDFEYSEYSLESSKGNRTIQDDNPNTSYNTNHCSRNDTTVKHSINNVFHSLNEYLSSDITPKKIENVHKNFKGVDILNESHASSFTVKSQTVDSSSYKNASQKNNQKGVNRTECSSFNNSLVEKTDTYSDTRAIISKQEVIEEKQENDIDKVGESVTNTLDNKCLLDETCEEQSSLHPPQNLVEIESSTKTLSEETSEELLVMGLLSKDSCDDTNLDREINCERNTSKIEDDFFQGNEIHLENNDSMLKNECLPTDNQVSTNKSECSPMNNQVNMEIKEESLPINNQASTDKTEEYSEQTGNETQENSIIDQKSIEHEERIEFHEVKHEESPENVEMNSGIEKIGFNNDVELDERDIEQYFQELEEELGFPNQEMIKEKNEDSSEIKEFESEAKSVESISSEYSRITKIEEINKEKDECELQPSECSKHDSIKDEAALVQIETIHNDEMKEPTLQKQEFSSDDSSSDHTTDLKPSTESGENCTNEKVEETLPHITEQDKYKEEADLSSVKAEQQSENCDRVSNKEVTSETCQNNPEDDPHECEKNSRPQILTLKEEVPETTRKISLIGEPGSTPYNNQYSTNDFAKTISSGSGDHKNARATSPTYSDVSTDSVSSSSSDDTTEYKDAETQNQKQVEETSELASKEIVQNNMIHPVEISRNDVTMDKDFKNNLKTGNARAEDGASTSCVQLDKSGDVQMDSQDSEGACAINVETNNEESSETALREEEQQRRIRESSNSAGIDWLGKQAPLWIPDAEAMSCLHCDMKFTVIKRRHHCRACGLVLCSKCCNLKYRLEYLNAEARVCKKCFDILDKDTNSNSGSEISQESSSPSRNLNATQDNLGQPNPNNPLEYCSTVPPTQQVEAGSSAVPSVMVPVGVLKRKGSNKGRSNKSVMFCDGIRPGSDLTNLDTDFNYSESQKSEKLKKSPDKSSKTGRNLDMIDAETKSFIPRDEKSLPPTVTIFKTDIKYSPCANNSSVVEMLRNESLTFALQSNVFVHVKIINMDCCVSRVAWCFSTEGLINVGQDEIVILLEFVENECLLPKEIFVHLNYVYLEAVKGSSVKELGMSLHPSSPFLGSKNHFGFIYIRPTFQCLQNVIVPKEPYLIGILIHRWETPWAKLFPLRLILRLGAEYKYYPSPIISTRDRDSVFVEIGHTIINLLADFRNFSYTLPQIRGLTIHMEDKNTTVTIPKNRYDQVLKSLSNSSDHILAFAGNFSTVADSHLVCIQDTQSASNNYSTHAINICNQPRKVTGASFIVFNGALKSTSGLTAKSNIVEDGLMIQILPEHMLQVRDSLKNMKSHTIKCGCINEESDETVTIVWGEPDTGFNVGVLSPIDNKDLTGIPSMRVHNGKDYTCNSGNRLIRWTEVFISQSGEDSTKNQETIDISKISENISKATCQALVKYLDLLVSNSFYKIGLRAHIHVENVSYSAGSNNVKLPPIYMKSLDNELIPVLHRIASNNVTEQPIVLELIFRILNI